jgi:myo-inositol 2-dehydrogenase / D-chiro-inositol 1-dehydrogenase
MKAPASSSIPRRSFLQGGLLAAAPLILPFRARGQAPPSERIHVAMIGCGRWGSKVNLDPFLAMPDVMVTAVCDVDAWRMDFTRRKIDDHYAKSRPSGQYKGCKAYADFRELLADPSIDAVMVSTCDHWHVPIALAALRAGKDVSVEKPISLSIREGRLLADEARRLGRVTRNDSEFRGDARMRRAVAALRDGRIGKLRSIQTTVPKGDVTAPPPGAADPVPAGLDYDMWLGPVPEQPYLTRRVHDPERFDRPHWMRVRDYCEGMITNWGTHLNDIAQMALGADSSGPVRIQAKRWEMPPRENLWNVLVDFAVEYQYANGEELHYQVGGSEVFVRLEGENGWVKAWYMGKPNADTPDVEASDPKILAGLDKALAEVPAWGDKEDFIRCVRSRERTMQDVEVGHRTCSMCQLGHISVQLEGRAITWDPATEQSPDPDVMRLTDRPAWRGHWLEENPRA